jgi:opacity protein-like surface antigen
MVFQDGESQSGQNGSSLKFDSETGFRFAFDYNFNNNLSLGIGFEFIRPDYLATIVDVDTNEEQSIRYTADQVNTQIRGIWNIFDGPLTPFIEASLGWSYFDSNFASEPPRTGCWYDPLWGYICSTFYETYTDTSFSYGAGAGVRWDINESFFLKGGYHYLTLDNSASSKPQLQSGRLEFGWRF